MIEQLSTFRPAHVPSKTVAGCSTRGTDDSERNRLVQIAIKICQLISQRPMTLQEIADGVQLGSRTARRYVYALRAAGIDIEESVLFEDGDDADEPSAGRCKAKRYRLKPIAWRAALALPLD